MREPTMKPEQQVQVLPEVVQNKIAAGEVVERPASVVKELVENALDAGAKRIVVDIEEGGQRLVRVTDDGCGMSEKNLILSIERHATSKIADVDDIFRIRTMGFRGEALPSIGSVSHMIISTARAGEETGFRLAVEGGAAQAVQPCPPRPGTVVEIRDLFYNTPARKKFMKSPSAETAAISETLTRIALAHPQIAFRLTGNSRLSLDMPAHGSLAERISALFGRSVADSLTAVAYERPEGVRVEGFCARPAESRSNSRNIYTFLNRRWIRHPGLLRVVRDAYREMLPARRYPFTVLYIDINPETVDVNVHPAKEEVRFENDRLVIGSVRRAVEEALLAPAGCRENSDTSSAQTNGDVARFDVSNTAPSAQAAEAAPRYQTSSFSPGTKVGEVANPVLRPVLGNSIPQNAAIAETSSESSLREQQNALPLPKTSQHKVLAQAGNRYLVVECPEGIKLVDQHALHERWNYERLQAKDRPVSSQKMLLPVVVELSPAEAALFDEALPILRESGFDVETFGVATLSISAAPDIVKPNKVEQVIRDVFADVEHGKGAVESVRNRILASLACRSAVLFGQSLPPEALTALMDKFDEAKQPLTCPHGRPTTMTLTWDELERRFGRT